MSKAVASMGQKLTSLSGTIITTAKPKLNTFMKYAKVELAPPTPGEVVEGIKGFTTVLANAQKGTWKKLTVKEGLLNTCVGIEIVCWFFVGEVIGKGGVSGYKV